MDCQTGLVAAKSKLLTLLKKIEARERKRKREREREIGSKHNQLEEKNFSEIRKKKIFLGWFGGVGWPPPEGCSCFSLHFLSLLSLSCSLLTLFRPFSKLLEI